MRRIASSPCSYKPFPMLTDYIHAATFEAHYEILEDGTFYGEIGCDLPAHLLQQVLFAGDGI